MACAGLMEGHWARCGGVFKEGTSKIIAVAGSRQVVEPLFMRVDQGCKSKTCSESFQQARGHLFC